MPRILDALTPDNPAFWLFGSWLVAVIAANLGWLLLYRLRAGPLSLPTGSGVSAAALWLGAALFFLVPPLYAWRRGAVSSALLGLTELDWRRGIVAGVPLMALTLGILLFGWLFYRRAVSTMRGRAPARLLRAASAARAGMDGALHQWHWSFYRAAAIGLLMMLDGQAFATTPLASAMKPVLADPVYWGSWGGLVLAAIEWGLNPFARAGWRRSRDRDRMLLRAALAASTTALFLLTRNFWLCLSAHAIVEVAIAGWFPLDDPLAQKTGFPAGEPGISDVLESPALAEHQPQDDKHNEGSGGQQPEPA